MKNKKEAAKKRNKKKARKEQIRKLRRLNAKRLRSERESEKARDELAEMMVSESTLVTSHEYEESDKQVKESWSSWFIIPVKPGSLGSTENPDLFPEMMQKRVRYVCQMVKEGRFDEEYLTVAMIFNSLSLYDENGYPTDEQRHKVLLNDSCGQSLFAIETKEIKELFEDLDNLVIEAKKQAEAEGKEFPPEYLDPEMLLQGASEVFSKRIIGGIHDAIAVHNETLDETIKTAGIRLDAVDGPIKESNLWKVIIEEEDQVAI